MARGWLGSLIQWHWPDMLLIGFFALGALAALNDAQLAQFAAKELSLWFVYEVVGVFFLIAWAGLFEGEEKAPPSPFFRAGATLLLFSGNGALMHLIWKVSPTVIALSTIGTLWTLLNPVVRPDRPSVFQIGQEACLALVSLLTSLFFVGFVGSIAEQTLSRPFDRTTFEAVVVMSIGALYYLLRWQLVAWLIPAPASGRR